MRRPPAVLALVVLAAAALAAGCASSALAGDGSQDQIRDLEARVLELQRKAAMSEVELTRLREQVAELQAQIHGRAQGRLADPMSAQPPGQGAGTARRVSPRPAEPVTRDIAAPIPTPIEVRDIDVPAGGGSAAGRKSTPAPPASQAPAAAPATGPVVPKSTTEAVTPAVQAMYDRGYTLFHQGHYVDAETSFQRFLQANPTSELADNAQYWIGECRYSRGDLKGALAAFRETVARFPDGAKVPDALLKAGRSLEGLGDVEGARALYQEVARRFPNTAVAAVAEERRAKLP